MLHALGVFIPAENNRLNQLVVIQSLNLAEDWTVVMVLTGSWSHFSWTISLTMLTTLDV